MARAFIIMLDSFGLGATEDAQKYGDEKANTLLHIAQWCEQNNISFKLPNLVRLGLNGALKQSCGQSLPNVDENLPVTGMFGAAAEISHGKDTQSGHWEMAGVPVLFDWGYFPPAFPSFPNELLTQFIKLSDIPGVLGNKHASGTVIINELGAEHQKTGKPIVYTSADSVFQIAAHEETFGLQRLYDISQIARKLVDKYNIGRVIARPFLGTPGHYYRTGNRRDYATPPHEETLLDFVINAGGKVIAIGKVADIYAHKGISKYVKASGNENLFQTFINEAQQAPDNSITFVNLVDFDMEYGHRRDVRGYAKALEELDSWMPAFEKIMRPGDIAVLTADHGCDPTQPGSDHTRENVPVLWFGPGIKTQSLGLRATFADIGQSIAQHLGLPALKAGTSFI